MLSIEGSNNSNEILLCCQLGIFRSLITTIDYSEVYILNLNTNISWTTKSIETEALYTPKRKILIYKNPGNKA